MANDNRKLDPVALSSLAEIDDPAGFWIFGSKDKGDGTIESGRYLFENLAEYARRLQLERRLTFTMERSAMDLFIDEPMTIYKVSAVNVGKLSLVIGGVETVVEVNSNKELEIEIPAKSIVTFNATRLLTDAVAYLYVYATLKLD